MHIRRFTISFLESLFLWLIIIPREDTPQIWCVRTEQAFWREGEMSARQPQQVQLHAEVCLWITVTAEWETTQTFNKTSMQENHDKKRKNSLSLTLSHSPSLSLWALCCLPFVGADLYCWIHTCTQTCTHTCI